MKKLAISCVSVALLFPAAGAAATSLGDLRPDDSGRGMSEIQPVPAESEDPVGPVPTPVAASDTDTIPDGDNAAGSWLASGANTEATTDGDDASACTETVAGSSTAACTAADRDCGARAGSYQVPGAV